MQDQLFKNDPAFLLCKAAAQGDVATVRSFIAGGVKVDQTDGFGSTALHWAAMNDRVAVVDCLLSLGADALRRNARNETALHIARNVGATEALKLMSKKICEETIVSERTKPMPETRNPDELLYRAVCSGVPLDVVAALDAGANPNLDVGPFPILHLSVAFGMSSIVSSLLSKGANYERKAPSLHGISALMVGAALGRLDCCVKMVSSGCDLEAVDDFGRNAFHYAAAFGCASIVRLLSERCAELKNSTCSLGRNALHYAAMMDQTRCIDVLECVSVDVFDVDGKAPLHLAAEHAGQKTISRLLAHPLMKTEVINLQTSNRHGETVLHILYRRGRKDLIDRFKSADEDIVDNYGFKPGKGMLVGAPLLSRASGGLVERKFSELPVFPSLNWKSYDDSEKERVSLEDTMISLAKEGKLEELELLLQRNSELNVNGRGTSRDRLSGKNKKSFLCL